MLRQELSQYLLFHSTNTKNPMLGPVDEEIDDEDDDKEECKVTAKSDAAKSNTATSGISHAANSNTGTGSSQQDSHVDKSTGVTPPELPLGHNSTPDSESTVLTPPVRYFKRRVVPRNAPNVTFEECRFLPSESCDEVYKLIQMKFDAVVVLAVGETTMTGGDLLEFLEEGHNALSIMNAFVHCVKFDDKTKSYHQSRIIIPTKDLISCPIDRDGEWIVFFVDVEAKDQVTLLHSSDSKLTQQMDNLAKTFGKHVHQAFVNDLDGCLYEPHRVTLYPSAKLILSKLGREDAAVEQEATIGAEQSASVAAAHGWRG